MRGRVDNCACPDKDCGSFQRPARNRDLSLIVTSQETLKQSRKDTFREGANLIMRVGKALCFEAAFCVPVRRTTDKGEWSLSL